MTADGSRAVRAEDAFDVPVVAGFDINALRAKAAKKPKKA